MNKQIPFLIIGLIVLYVILSSFNENFNVVQEEIPKHIVASKKELVIKPNLFKGHVPIGSETSKETQKLLKYNLNCKADKASEPSKKGNITYLREGVDKYIKESMLLNKPNHNLGFLPSNVREMELTYNKPNQIGKLPLYIGKVPHKIKLAKLTHKMEIEEEEGIEEI
jgi:hypothetical protein